MKAAAGGLLDLERFGFLRAAVVTPAVTVADPGANAEAIINAARVAAGRGARLVVFPELAITGYTCADLFYQRRLRDAALDALLAVAAATADLPATIVVGVPLALDGRLFNCAAVLGGGAIVGIVPKTFLPTTGEFYEARWFSPSFAATRDEIAVGNARVPFGADLLFEMADVPGAVLGIEICEDLWAPNPPSSALAVAGATVLVNPTASDELIGKAAYRRDLVRNQSGRCLAAYLYAASGPGESTTDLVFSGHSMIAENASMLAETERFRFETTMALADIDLERLAHERLHSSSFSASAAPRPVRRIAVSLPAGAPAPAPLLRAVSPTPFVPAASADRAANCAEIFAITSTALARRLLHTRVKTVTIGVSGGLDSTLALLATARAFDLAGLPRDGIHAITMPGLGTTKRTRGNAERLTEAIGARFEEIPISAATLAHFADIGHDPAVADLTYENAQARERTQVLMDRASEVGGFVVGTGDLSELALGWATFNGDHMSMYNPNAGIPKTLVRYIVEWVASTSAPALAAVLEDICATPISPELLPSDGVTSPQATEATLGSYRLHDFFLFEAIRYGFTPARVFFLARVAFAGEFADDAILAALRTFYRRFFANQFKRSAIPDGPKVGSVALSPRGDWRMPSDASAAAWLAEVEALASEGGAG